MKKLILLIIAPVIIFASMAEFNTEINYNSLSKSQKKMLVTLYNYGKQFDLGYTIAAIAWKESNVGEYMLNINSRNNYDCGMFQNNVKSVHSREGRKLTKYSADKTCQKLMVDINYALLHVTEELEYWKNLYPDDFMKIWTSYNKGFNNSKAYTDEYALDILLRVKILQKYIGVQNKRRHIQ